MFFKKWLYLHETLKGKLIQSPFKSGAQFMHRDTGKIFTIVALRRNKINDLLVNLAAEGSTVTISLSRLQDGLANGKWTIYK